MVIGLTGPTGSGKSEISKYLKKKGFFIIDSDKIVKDLYANCNKCIDDVDRHFEGVVDNNVVNKKKLAGIVFQDKKLLVNVAEIKDVYSQLKDIEKNGATGREYQYLGLRD